MSPHPPRPGAGEVRVRVSVSGINPTDVNFRRGAVPHPIDGFQIPHQAVLLPAQASDDLGANLALDVAVSGPHTVIAAYATAGPDPVLPVRALIEADVTLRFVLLYGVPPTALQRASSDIVTALRAGALTELPSHRFPLTDIAAAHEAVEAKAGGKVLVDMS